VLIVTFPSGTLLIQLQPDNLEASGSDLVYSQALLAVIGALALEQGGAVANRVTKERILIPMGMKASMDDKVHKIQES